MHKMHRRQQKSFDNLDIKSSFRSKAFNYFSEFANSTGIHGFKYLGERNRSVLEKFWWLIFVGISLYFCLALIVRTYVKWDIYPVLVSFARSPTPVWQIPFPAITICSETKTKQTKFNFTNAYHLYNKNNMSIDMLEQYDRVALICDRHIHDMGNQTVGLDTINFLREIAPTFEEVFHECVWTGQPIDCRKLFSPILTEEGNCFTFNILDRSELFTDIVGNFDKTKPKSQWTLENGYDKDAPRDTYPRRAISSGASAGLFLTLRSFSQDLDYLCKGPVQGFKLLLHNPAEIPRLATHYFRAPLDQEVVVSVKPEMMTTSQGLLNYKPHRRQCFFPHERKLYFYRTYTQQNCHLECLTNWTLNACDCVAFYMPRVNTTQICGPGSIKCMYETRNHLTSLSVETAIEESHDDVSFFVSQCDCLPACTSLDYIGEHSQADFNWKAYYGALKMDITKNKAIHLTSIGVFFKDFQFITMERNELYGITDFLASCGGLLGLFIGFSFLSLIEILYYLSLRLICNILLHGCKHWYGKRKNKPIHIIPKVIIERVFDSKFDLTATMEDESDKKDNGVVHVDCGENNKQFGKN